MGLLGNNGGIMNTIRCDEQSYLIWKWHPQGSIGGASSRENAIRWGSSLSVKPGSVAAFLYRANGSYHMDYIEGPYDDVIKTSNLPVIASIIGAAYNGGTPFQAEIYFINLANIIQCKFGVPFFDVYDPRSMDYAVPVAVRGSISFKISDYHNFIEIHRLDNFSVEDFHKQIQDAVIRYVKSVITNVPIEEGIPVLHLERKIEEINNIIEDKIRNRMIKDFGVVVSGVDISDIEMDRGSEGFQMLKKVTSDVTTEALLAQKERTLNDIREGRNNEGVSQYMDTMVNPMNFMQGKYKGNSTFNNAKEVSKETQPPLVSSNSQYNVAINGQPAGPYDFQKLSELVGAGTLTKESLVWKSGMANWERAGEIEELGNLFNQTPPPIPGGMPPIPLN